MAGRVERRINDKFYFVLDEVGGSSDCESELVSDIDAKPINDSIEKTNLTDFNKTLLSTEKSVNDLNSINSELNVNNPILPNENISLSAVTLNYNNEENEKNFGNDLIVAEDKSLQKVENSVDSEELSAVVDMEIDSDAEYSEPSTKPLIKVTFRDETVEKRLKSTIIKYLSQKFDDFKILTNSENSLELEVYERDPRYNLEDDLLDFNLDTTPGDSHIDIPNYGKTHDLLLSDSSLEEKKKEGSKKLYASTASCFNCSGNHNLRDCPEAKDFRTINKNRLKFQTQKDKSFKCSRYHLDENQKFSHLMPGTISKKLRNALNLRRDQQPKFIYRMRLLGYPPAWLEEAKVSHSGVAMYDDSGAPVLEEDEEEGEIVPEGAKDKFDITKIVEFPGFNVPLPWNFKDESKYYKCPPLSEDQSKENLIKLLEPKTVQAYVKKSLSSQKLDDKALPVNELKRPASPTVEEMEEKKRQLLMELNIEESVTDSKPPSEDSSTCQTPTTEESCSSRTAGTVKNSEFGTPVLKSVSPFSKLPSREQFSCNVSDVIVFENLPNSTGKYETMREVISKIRISASKSQQE